MTEKKKQGFATMPPERVREISSKIAIVVIGSLFLASCSCWRTKSATSVATTGGEP